MRRRDFAVGLSLAAISVTVRAQTSAKPHRIALVTAAIPARELNETQGGSAWKGFFGELRRLGHIEGRNLIVERFSAEGHHERFADVAREVVSRDPDVIVAATGFLGMAFQSATTTIPIVAGMADPIRWGMVTSLAKPGGNLTGVSVDAGIEIHGKRLQILKETIPSLSTLAFLGKRESWDGPGAQQWREAGQRLGVSVVGMVLDASTPSEYQRLFGAVAKDRPDAIAVSEAGDQFAHRQLIVDLAAKNRLPAMYPYRDYVDLGGLMAYATDLTEAGRGMAAQVHEILNGAKPGDIPVRQATRYQLVINLRAAEAIGLAVPRAILALADEVIE